MGGRQSQQPDKRAAHVKRRRDQGVSFRKLGEEFDLGKSTAHRIYHSDTGGSMAKKSKKNGDIKPKSSLKNDEKGKLQPVKTDRGDFAFKTNRKKGS